MSDNDILSQAIKDNTNLIDHLNHSWKERIGVPRQSIQSYRSSFRKVLC